jgi:hypothetical protein
LRYWNNASSALETSAHRNPLIKEVLSPSTNIREINYMNIKTILTIRMLVSFPSGDNKSREGGRPSHSLEWRGEDKAKLKKRTRPDEQYEG